MWPFIDETTARVIGVESLLIWFQPLSAGAKREGRLRCFGFGDHDAWATQLLNLTSLEAWLASQEPDWNADFERLPELGTVLQNSVTLQESELFQLKRFLFYATRILGAATFDQDHLADAQKLAELMQSIHPETETSPRFVLSEGLDPGLGPARTARRATRNTLKLLRDRIEADIIETHGGRFDVHGFFRPAPGFPGDPRLDTASGPYTLNVPEIHEMQARLMSEERVVDELEMAIRERLTQKIRTCEAFLSHVEKTLLTLDLRLARIRLKHAIDGTWPVWGEAQHIQGFRSPLFKDPTSVDLEIANGSVIIAGPNMGGKSTVLKGVGLAQWCLHHLMPIPATSVELLPVNHVVYVGSEDNPDMPGLSAFGREIQRLVDWWQSSTPTLWLLDEIARGTHPEEGAKIATEVLNVLIERGDRVICATHFPQVTELPNAAIYRVAGLPSAQDVETALAQAEEPIECLKSMMDYRLVPSDPGYIPRDARVVALALGLKLKPEPRD